MIRQIYPFLIIVNLLKSILPLLPPIISLLSNCSGNGKSVDCCDDGDNDGGGTVTLLSLPPTTVIWGANVRPPLPD